MQNTSSMLRGFVACRLRNQLSRVRGIPHSIEEEEKVDSVCSAESFREIEDNMRQTEDCN